MARPIVRRALFYDLVGVGLTAYAKCAYRIRTVGRRLRLEPSTLLVANHPRDCDPVVMVGALYHQVHRVGREHRLVHFMLRADLRERGFFAGRVPVPEYRVPENVDDAVEAVGEIGFPCVVKPRRSY